MSATKHVGSVLALFCGTSCPGLEFPGTLRLCHRHAPHPPSPFSPQPPFSKNTPSRVTHQMQTGRGERGWRPAHAARPCTHCNGARTGRGGTRASGAGRLPRHRNQPGSSQRQARTPWRCRLHSARLPPHHNTLISRTCLERTWLSSGAGAGRRWASGSSARRDATGRTRSELSALPAASRHLDNSPCRHRCNLPRVWRPHDGAHPTCGM